ncbi:MAG: hypothetical protein GX422_15955 [Deltaproteobacteria bacterium]|nr:hypothetical protein [Deltaproteobacteria bacterium]
MVKRILQNATVMALDEQEWSRDLRRSEMKTPCITQGTGNIARLQRDRRR